MSLLSLLIGYFDFLSQGISSFKKSYVLYSMWYRKGKDVTCGQVLCPILGIFALHLTHPSAHTAVRSEQTQTHTHHEHTPGAVGSQCSGARGAVGGSVPCSRVSPQSWYWRWRERWTFTPPTDNSCWTWDSNPQPSGYKSDSLSIMPRLPM